MKTTRKQKLIALQELMNMETGEIYEDRFDYENILYEKTIQKNMLDKQIKNCEQCPNMNIPRYSNNCPGWGNVNSPFFFIGQSLHKPGMLTGLPFIFGSGYLLDCALRVIRLKRTDVFITNVVHCHPPNNRDSTEEEKENCLPFLRRELEIVQPRMVIALGADAKWAVDKLKMKTTKKQRVIKVKHPASFSYSAPEQKYEYVVKLATELEKVI